MAATPVEMKHSWKRYFWMRWRMHSVLPRCGVLLNERALFWSFLGFHVAFLWPWQFLPTVDGPSHLFNSLILGRIASEQWRYEEYFAVDLRLTPNLASHYLLVGLLRIFPPLTSERVLVSMFALGLPLAYRSFLQTLGDDFRLWSPFCFLFLFARVWFLGFYNYCFSVVLFFLVATFCIRHRESFGVIRAIQLFLLLIASFFTHLAGYALAASAAIWFSFTIRPFTRARVIYTCMAVAATLPLVGRYLRSTGFAGQYEGTGRIVDHLASLDLWSLFELQIGRVNSWFFGPYDTRAGCFFWMVTITTEFLIFTTLAMRRGPLGDATLSGTGGASVAGFGLGLASLLILLPDQLGRHGAFLHARLAILPPLLWIACCRPPGRVLVRNVCLAGLYGLVVVNLVLVSRFFAAANTQLAQFTAGIEEAGQQITIRVRTLKDRSLVPYLECAGAYYCLRTGNIDLGNYEAATDHFPVRWRNASVRAEEPDVYVLWTTGDQGAVIPDGYQRSWSKGRLSICKRERLLAGE